jgi:glycosyltransferase involved in cell wall biosynthesis
LRILHIIAPSSVGGAEQVVLDLSRALAFAGEEVHVAAVLDLVDAHPFLRQLQEPVRAHPIRLPPRAYGRERKKVKELFRDLAPDVVHTHGYRADVVDGPLARAAGIPAVTTVHGFTGGGLKNRMYELLQRRAHRGFDAVVAVSRPLAGELVRGGIAEERVHTIPNAREAPGELLSPGEARERLGVETDAFHVGWIGRVSHEKGPDLHLEALSRLRDLPFHATVIGDGRSREELTRRTLELGLADRIRWAGVIPEAGRLLRAFDVLVVSSRSEGTPMVVLEGMAAGVPLIVTRVGGVPDLVREEEAVLVPPESSGSLAEAVRRVFRDPEAARERARRAARRFEDVSSTEEWAAAHVALYSGLARNGGTGRTALDAVSPEGRA